MADITWILGVVVGTIVFVVVLVRFILWVTGPMTDAGRAFLHGLRNGDHEYVLMLMSSELRDQNPSLKEFTKNDMRLSEWTINRRKLSGPTGLLKGDMKFDNGQQRSFVMHLKHNGDSWEVVHFSVNGMVEFPAQW